FGGKRAVGRKRRSDIYFLGRRERQGSRDAVPRFFRGGLDQQRMLSAKLRRNHPKRGNPDTQVQPANETRQADHREKMVKGGRASEFRGVFDPFRRNEAG